MSDPKIRPERPMIFLFVGPQHIEELRNILNWKKVANHYIFFLEKNNNEFFLKMGRLLSCGVIAPFILNHEYLGISSEELKRAYEESWGAARGCDGKYELPTWMYEKIQRCIFFGKF